MTTTDAQHPDPADPDAVRTLAQLEALYGTPGEASLRKELPGLSPAYRALVEAAPFALLATSGPHGLDVSPRGDAPGFVVVQDERTLLLPDRRGNQRLDSLRNLVADPRVALLFMVPGVDETLRVNGRAEIRCDGALRERFAIDGKQPATVLVIRIETVYFQCARALLRSRLWQPLTWPARAALPTPGRMLADATAGEIDATGYDAALAARLPAQLY